MHKLVLGVNFGDEGKGLVTDYLCSNSPDPLVVRFNGGQQAGHTVVKNGVRHVFSNFGSGSLEDCPTYWSSFCTVDPIGVMNELKVLREKGVNPILYIDAKCPITTPFDILHNRSKRIHGTVGVGFGETLQREEDFYSLTFLDLFYKDVFEEKLTAIDYYYRTKMDFEGRDEDFYRGINDFKKACKDIVEVENVKLVQDFKSLLTHRRTLIFEGAQGLLLDQHYGFFPNVTRSNTGSKNPGEIWRQLFGIIPTPEIFLVTRAYQTRHGTGFMTNEKIPHKIKRNIWETNINHQFQGEFRRALLDVSLLEYAIRKDEFVRKTKNKSLVITCLDQVEDEWRFTYKGEIFEFKNERDFVWKIIKFLGNQDIKDVYVSHSDESNNLVEI